MNDPISVQTQDISESMNFFEEEYENEEYENLYEDFNINYEEFDENIYPPFGRVKEKHYTCPPRRLAHWKYLIYCYLVLIIFI